MFECIKIYYNRRACTLIYLGHLQSIEYFAIEQKVRKNDMCGIAGALITNSSKINPDLALIVSPMVSVIRHRSPDDLGVLAENGVALGRILALGIAYKKNVDNMSESPSIMQMERMRKLGGEIIYSDPHIPVLPKMHEHPFDLTCVTLIPQSLGQSDTGPDTTVILFTQQDDLLFNLFCCQ